MRDGYYVSSNNRVASIWSCGEVCELRVYECESYRYADSRGYSGIKYNFKEFAVVSCSGISAARSYLKSFGVDWQRCESITECVKVIVRRYEECGACSSFDFCEDYEDMYI